MHTYNTMSEALTDLAKRGYAFDFNLCKTNITCDALHQTFQPEAFDVVEVHRFDGMTSTDDESILYVIETGKGIKGTLLDAYGVYSDTISPELLKKLRFKR